MTLAPTHERFAHGSILTPLTDQKVKRQYHKAEDLFDIMFRKEMLDLAQYTAAIKLRKHYEGSLGRDVRDTEAYTAELRDLDGIPAQTYHADKLKEARQHVADPAWRLLEFGLLGCEHLADMGRFVFRVRCEKKARDGAKEAISGGLENLAIIWGLLHRAKPPSP